MSKEISSPIDEVLEDCRRSRRFELAEDIEYLVDHDMNQFGPVYRPNSMPNRSGEDAYALMYAFMAGRAVGPPENKRGECQECGRDLGAGYLCDYCETSNEWYER